VADDTRQWITVADPEAWDEPAEGFVSLAEVEHYLTA
jgi:hypothetical protein